jgi:sugar-specific transcriptional regulator TrmB
MFHAMAEQTASVAYANTKIKALEILSSEFGGSQLPSGQDSNPTDINLIYGAENIYEESAKLLDTTKQEMLVISIGEPITPNLLLAVKNAKGRGVTIKMIVHKCDEENRMVLENFKKNGYIIRHFPGWGFHMAIYDREKTLLIINNPENTSERAAMLINSEGLSGALSDYFHSTWKKAKRV